jgi:hypothetical protein
MSHASLAASGKTMSAAMQLGTAGKQVRQCVVGARCDVDPVTGRRAAYEGARAHHIALGAGRAPGRERRWLGAGACRERGARRVRLDVASDTAARCAGSVHRPPGSTHLAARRPPPHPAAARPPSPQRLAAPARRAGAVRPLNAVKDVFMPALSSVRHAYSFTDLRVHTPSLPTSHYRPPRPPPPERRR